LAAHSARLRLAARAARPYPHLALAHRSRSGSGLRSPTARCALRLRSLRVGRLSSRSR